LLESLLELLERVGFVGMLEFKNEYLTIYQFLKKILKNKSKKMNSQKAKIPKLIINSELPIWLSVYEIITLTGFGRTKSYDEINVLIETIKHEYPKIYKTKSKYRRILTSHFIKYNEQGYSREDVLQSLENGISLEKNAIINE
jgi:radical SAM superfamily enzyme YgiQ (UPF0313 family)